VKDDLLQAMIKFHKESTTPSFVEDQKAMPPLLSTPASPRTTSTIRSKASPSLAANRRTWRGMQVKTTLGHLALCLLLAGCGAATLRVMSNKADEANTSPKRIFVQSHLVNSTRGVNFGPDFARAFNEHLIESLGKCGTTATVYNVTGLELGNGAILKEIEAFKPDALMTVTRTGGVLWGEGGKLATAIFDVSLYDATRKKVAWRAFLDFRRGGTLITSAESAGRLMATDLLNQLRKDGFFPGCAQR
jgi:predicted membrane protein